MSVVKRESGIHFSVNHVAAICHHVAILSRCHRCELICVVLKRDLLGQVEECRLDVFLSDAEILELRSGTAYHDHVCAVGLLLHK